MNTIYDTPGRPVAGFASQLELDWSIRFRVWKWQFQYIGDTCRYADFQIGRFKVEVKPTGMAFLQAALARSVGEIFIVQGKPAYSPEWWWVRREQGELATAYRLPRGPRYTRNGLSQSLCPAPVAWETVDEFHGSTTAAITGANT